MAVSKKAWLGVAREATSGTAIATPTMLAPSKAGFKNVKKFVYLDEERGTRDGNNGRVLTVQHAQGTFKGKWYNDSGPYFLIAFMGAEAPSQPSAGTDPTVWLHTLTLADVPPSLTLFRALDTAATYQLAYSVVEKIKYSWAADAKLLEVDGSFLSQYSGPKMVSPPARPADTTVLPFGGYVPTIKLNGVQSLDVDEMDIELSQKITLWFNSAGNRTFVTAYFGERTAKINFEARFDNDTLWEQYETGVDQLVNIDFEGQNISHAFNQNIIFNFPIVGIDEADHDTSKDNVKFKAKCTARPGTTVNSLFSATVQNTVASYTV